MPVTLERVVPWGRSLDEYRQIFALSPADLRSNILGCADGPASFNAELTAQGGNVVSVDPIYAFSGEQIAQRVEETHQDMVAQVHANIDNFLWTRFTGPAEMGRHRLAVMRRFLADFDAGLVTGRYRVQELPTLDFAGGSFDLALCSHFLFLYSAQLSYQFHQAAMMELCRVAREVRIFPLLTLAVEQSPYVTPLCEHLRAAGYQAQVVTVDYEFQRGGNQMLQVWKSRRKT